MPLVRAGLLAGLVLALAAPTEAQELRKILPADGGPGLEFGAAVAVEGGVLAVGSRKDDDAGAAAGSVYLHDAASGAQLLKLVAADGAAGDQFGFSVALSGGVVAVGAPYDDDRGADSGSVYLFDAASGAPLLKLAAADGAAGDEFGYDVALDGGVLAVGAKRDDDHGRDSGALYLFDAGSGALIAKVTPNDGAADDNFGGAVDLDAGVVVVGAHGDDDLGFLSGSAYLFDAATGAQLRKLLANDGGFNDFFGAAVAIDGGVVAVGAWADSLFGDHSGSAYLFDAASGQQTAKVVPADGADRDHFGIALDLDAGTVVVGADGDDDNGFNSGSAYLYDAGSGALIRKLLPSDGDVHDEFGAALAIAGGVVAAGVAGDDDLGAASGSAYVFGSLALSVAGAPGGSMSFQVGGATPLGTVALVHAFGAGAHVVANPLTGNLVTTGLSAHRFAVGFVGAADALGAVVTSANVPAGASGQVHVQAIDATSDGISNVVGL